MQAGSGVKLGVSIAAALTLAIVSVGAQQTPPAQPAGKTPAGQTSAPQAPGTPAAPPAKAVVPVAASTLAADPKPFYGEPITVTGAVDRSLSDLAFSIDQDPTTSTGKDVLILAPRLNAPVDPNSYVTVIGEAMAFDPDAIAQKSKTYKIDLPPDVIAQYKGKPVVLATSIINAKFVDLAKRLPPPMSAEEESFDKVMKKVGPAFAALRKGLDGSDTAAATENAATLKQAFAETEAFWKSKGRPDAVAWAQDARKQVDAIAKAVPTAKWDAAKDSAGTLGKACQSCHTTYRERFDDGSFRIKMPDPTKTTGR